MKGTPFQVSARDYLEAGWSPLPLPTKEKSPVPTGFTGALGLYVTQVQLDKWLTGKAKAGKLLFRPGNVALRLPKGVIGVDVDAYGTKTGEATLAAAEEAWGPLPPTWVTTSRTDGVSGIRLFRITPDLAWPGQLPQGGGVELLRWDHRFAIVAPSVHDKTGLSYKWYLQEEVIDPRNGDGDPDQVDVIFELIEQDGFPEFEDLALLPDEWEEGLTSGVKWKDRPVDEEMDVVGLREWVEARPSPDSPCSAMRKTVTDYARALRKASDDGGMHDAARNSAWAVLGDANAGHSGVAKALGELRRVFLTNVADRRADIGAARSEWTRIVHRGAQKVSADSPPEEADPCDSISGRKAASGRRGLDWDALTELGNANRLVSVMAGRARWVDAWNSWVIWSENDRIWRVDTDRQVERWAVKAINEIEAEIAHLTDEKAVKAYKAHIKASLNVGKQRAMIEMARARNGIIIPAESFDSNPRLLATGGGVIELNGKGATLREAQKLDYFTLRTPVKFEASTRNKLWSNFLKRFVPDPEILTWLQKLVGYSLLGFNPARLLIFVIGKSSTGKTTFAESLSAALGDLAGPMPASVLRDNADDKPRPDLLGALPKRIVIAEELSAAQHLHPDQIKRLTGGGVVTARAMRSNVYVSRVPAFTPWLVMNSAPTINSADVALYRRILVVPFNEQIKHGAEIIDYRERLITESREAILAWAVEGYDAYSADPEALWRVPRGALEANQQLRDEMSDVDSFLAEVCIRDSRSYVIPTHLYEEYQIWCEANSISTRDRVSGTKLGRELGAKGFDKKQVKIGGHPTWVRTGLKLRKNAD